MGIRYLEVSPLKSNENIPVPKISSVIGRCPFGDSPIYKYMLLLKNLYIFNKRSNLFYSEYNCFYIDAE